MGLKQHGQKWYHLGCILEVKSTRLLRGINEREREVKGDSKAWGLHNCLSGTPVIPMGKAAKETGLEAWGPGGAGPQGGQCGKDYRKGGVQTNWGRGASSRKCGLRDPGIGNGQTTIREGHDQRQEAQES